MPQPDLEATVTQPITPDTLVSDCHKAPMRVVGGGEGTNHYECLTCGKSCNWTEASDALDDNELRDKLYAIFYDLGVPSANTGMEKPYVIDAANQIQALLTHTLQTYKDEIVSGLNNIRQTDYDQGDNKFTEDTEWNDALKEALAHINSVSERRGIK